MRVGFFYIALMICSQQLLLAHTSSGQELEKRVMIGAENETLPMLFQKLKIQTGLSFVFRRLEGAESSTITFKAENRSVKEVLDLALKGKNLTYKLDDRTVTIYKVKSDESKNMRSEEVASKTSAKVDLPSIITGIVKDAATQEPLAGVNVIVKGTTRGTTTDSNGKFAIDAQDDDWLVFTFIGYKGFEAQVSGQTTINPDLEPDITALQEVEVNAGYWNVKDKEQTGNISKVSSDEIQRQPISNPLSALQGRVPGIYIQQATGVPGGGFTVRIRGQNSMINGNNPLYIVDGVPFPSTSLSSFNSTVDIIGNANPLGILNPADIESIEVLKDADATAIYGSRGANGVILISTKRKGRPNKNRSQVAARSGTNNKEIESPKHRTVH